jgi:hypothetical protein
VGGEVVGGEVVGGEVVGGEVVGGEGVRAERVGSERYLDQGSSERNTACNLVRAWKCCLNMVAV